MSLCVCRENMHARVRACVWVCEPVCKHMCVRVCKHAQTRTGTHECVCTQEGIRVHSRVCEQVGMCVCVCDSAMHACAHARWWDCQSGEKVAVFLLEGEGMSSESWLRLGKRRPQTMGTASPRRDLGVGIGGCGGPRTMTASPAGLSACVETKLGPPAPAGRGVYRKDARFRESIFSLVATQRGSGGVWGALAPGPCIENSALLCLEGTWGPPRAK